MMSMIAGPDALAVEAGARVLATDGNAVEPAARVAEIGFPVDERVAAHWNTPFQLSSGTTILDYVRANPEASRLYLKADGTTHRTGATIRNAGYVATLRRIGELGADEVYAGPLGG